MATTLWPTRGATRAAIHPGVSASHCDGHVAVMDGLRGLAILVVVWYHVWLVTQVASSLSLFGRPINLQVIAETGFVGVDLFFFVSGFCLFYPYARHLFEGRELLSIGEFATRRLLKIVPSYLLALTAFAVLYHQSFASWADLAKHYWLHAVFVHPFFMDSFGSISGPLWTLGIEVQFYAIFPIVCWVFRRRPLAMYITLVTLAVAYRTWLAMRGATDTLFATDQLPAVVDLFASGMLTAYLVVRLRAHHTQLRLRHRTLFSGMAIAGLAAVALLLVQLAGAGESHGPPGAYAWLNTHRLLFAICFTAIGTGFSLGLPAWHLVLANRLLIFLAAISYNLYLWHLEIIWQLHLLLSRWPPVVVGGVAICCALAIGSLVTFAVERPLLRMRGNRRRLVEKIEVHDPVPGVVDIAK